jgi:metal-responsive CopG/Arc/MetJ family transcriptional regulator
MSKIMEGISPLPLNTSGLGRFVKKLRQPMKDGILVSVYEKQRSKAADTITEQRDAIDELVEALEAILFTLDGMHVHPVLRGRVKRARTLVTKCKAQEQGDE